MQCAQCGATLLPGKRFCHACGTEAALPCTTCGAALEPGWQFCPDCGSPVGAAVPPPGPAEGPPADRLARHIPAGLAEKIRAAQGMMTGERKQVTVLFCDLAGSTAIAERLDPEEYHELLEQYLEHTLREIYRFEGIVNQLAGDGMMALFGAPIAHEDAPQRAVRAALAIRTALAQLNERTLARRGLELAARIGIHTGPVVVGTVGNDLKMDYTAIGDTTNLASRLESLARPGAILVSEATHRLVRGFFVVRPTGPLAVKGKREPVTAYEVHEETTAATPMTIAAERGLTPLVGRDEELEQLEACYQRLAGGAAQVVAVVGEAGSGKSRLLHELRQRLAATTATVFEGRCAALSQAVPYAPFVTMFREHLEVATGGEAAAGCAPPADLAGGEGSERVYPLLCRLLSVPVERLRELPPEEMKRESFDAVARLLLKATERGPIVIIIEDLHWIDDASRELLETLVARLASARAMVIVSQRPDAQATWRPQGAFTQLVLRRLSDDDVTSIVRAVAGAPLPADLERRLVAKAEGSPFFAEEITRGLIEEGYWIRDDDGHGRLTRPVAEVTIPGTVQEVIAARVDRLRATAKRTLQVAAVLGRQFSRRHLTALLEDEGIDVAQELDELERRGLLHRKHLLGTDDYRFGESLTQEVAYETLLLRQRRILHERVAGLLEAAGGAGGAERSALLAHHWARSDNVPRALETLIQAGREAEELPSYRTAARFYREAWELAEAALGRNADDAAAQRAGLAATAGLARAAVIFGAADQAEAERAARRGRELAEALGDTETLAGLLVFHGALTMARDHDSFVEGLRLAEEGVRVAERAGLPETVMRLSRGLAINYAFDGRFSEARAAVERVRHALAGSAHERDASDLWVSTCWIHDTVLRLADDLDAAFASARDTYAAAKRAPNRTVIQGTAVILAEVHFLRGEYADALRWADEGLVVGEEIANVAGLTAPAAIALASRKALGEPLLAERYLKNIAQGLASGRAFQSNVRFVAEALNAVGTRAHVERFVTWLGANPVGGRLREATFALALGEATARLGDHGEAERALGRAIALAEEIGTPSILGAALCARAEVAAARGDTEAATRLVARTLEVCRAHGLAHHAARAARIAIGDATAASA